MNYKIFTFDYLIQSDLNEEDLYWLFDTPSMNYSFIKEMCNMLNKPILLNDLIDKITVDNTWLSEYHFRSKKDYKLFKSQMIKAIKNIFSYSDVVAKKWVENWMIRFGLSIHNNKT